VVPSERKAPYDQPATPALALGLLLGILLIAAAPAFAQDPFAGLTNTTELQRAHVAAALMLSVR